MSGILGDRRGFRPLFACQFLSALGDNVLRNAVATVALWGTAAQAPSWVVAVAAGAFVAPTVILSGLGGELADRTDKAALVRRLKLVELPIALLAALGLVLHALPLCVGALALSGVVAALFGPVKYGVLPELVVREKVATANAAVEAATFAAILLGSVGGTLLAGGGGAGTPLPAGVLPAGLVLVVAILSWLSARRIRALPAASPGLPVRANLFRSTGALLALLRSDRRLWRAALGAGWFWCLGAVTLSLLPGLVLHGLHAGPRTASFVLALFAVGVAVGSGAAAFLAGGRVLLASAAVGAVLAGLGLGAVGVLVGMAGASGAPVLAALFLAALGAGMIAVPTQTALQSWAVPAERARAVGGGNVVSALAMVAGTVVVTLLELAGWREPAILGGFGLGSLLLAPVLLARLPRNPAGELCWMLFRLLFRVELCGGELLPQRGSGAVMIAPNHVSWLDAALLFALAEEAPTFVIDADVARLWWVRPFLRVVPALPVSAASPHALRAMVAAMRDGRSLVLFPEGRITITGSLMEVMDGAATVADRAGVPVLPVRISGLERTRFSRLTDAQTRRAWFPPVSVTVLPARRLEVPADVAGRARRAALTARLRDVMEEAVFRTRPVEMTLAQAVGRAARLHGLGRLATEDPVSGRLSYRKLLAGAELLGALLADGTVAGERVGLLLPTANACALSLLGLSARGRVPALLNATAGLAGLRAAIAAAELRTVVCSRGFVEKARLGAVVEALAPEVRFVWLEDLRGRSGRLAKLRAVVRATLRPDAVRVRARPDDPAVVLFTSGSSGTPKGVVLTHRNLLSNVAQVAGRIGFGRDDRVLNTLPMFHAFGLTGGTLLPILSGIPVFLYPSPLHYATIPVVAYNWNASAMFGTSTFLRGYARRAHPTAFRSLRLVVAGAEKVQPAVREVWAERFGLRILEGYGATECSPVLAVNTPSSNRTGTMGRLLPGMRMRLEPVEGMDAEAGSQVGRLLVSGPNVMAGYLRVERPGMVEAPAAGGNGGWYDTGDVVRLDPDGHLTMVGRETRIAKPGGEMVSLAAVEELAQVIWPDAPSVAVAVPDPRRGERVVLLTERTGATRTEYLAAARARGVPEVAMPAELRVVDRLPMLGSGKPDFVAATRLVTEAAATEAAGTAADAMA